MNNSPSPLIGESDLLWQNYLALETQGLRPNALHMLSRFIEVFERIAPQQRRVWIEDFCNEVLDEGHAYPLRYPLFTDVLAPYLIEQYHQLSPTAPRWIAALAHWFNSTPRFREQLGLGYSSPVLLLREARKRDPANLLVQRKLAEVIAQQLDYSIHEVPAGVLYGHDVATVAECATLLEEGEEFRQLAQNTHQLEHYDARIRKWEYYIQAYADYIGYRTDYHGFADYLRQHARS